MRRLTGTEDAVSPGGQVVRRRHRTTETNVGEPSALIDEIHAYVATGLCGSGALPEGKPVDALRQLVDPATALAAHAAWPRGRQHLLLGAAASPDAETGTGDLPIDSGRARCPQSPPGAFAAQLLTLLAQGEANITQLGERTDRTTRRVLIAMARLERAGRVTRTRFGGAAPDVWRLEAR